MSDVTSQEHQTTTQDEEQERLGRLLAEAREYLGLSQEFVAERLNIPRASISAMETGKRKVSSLELKQLARLYKRPIQFFLGEEDGAEAAMPTDATTTALYRATRALSEQDKQQVLRFAQFLRSAGRAPTLPASGEGSPRGS